MRMRISDRLALLDKVGRELQSRFTFSDIDVFLAAFGVKPPREGAATNSKWVYSKVALADVTDDILLHIAGELGIAGATSQSVRQSPPRNWDGVTKFRLFISHVSVDKLKATRLKDCLAPYGIAGFVAHEDIHPTLEWQSEIERALFTMDGFLAMHTKGFAASNWCQQEVGFAIGRGVKMISLRMGEDPTGFIGKHQALARRDRTAEQIAEEINAILAADRQTADRLAAARPPVGVDDDIPF